MTSSNNGSPMPQSLPLAIATTDYSSPMAAPCHSTTSSYQKQQQQRRIKLFTFSSPRFRLRGGAPIFLSLDFGSQWHCILFSLCLIFIFVQTQTFQLSRYLFLQSSDSSPYNLDNPHPQWCPYATCHNSPICKPCQRRFLIVIATGRSGSTTVINMLDLLPNVRMAGENNGHLMWGFYAVNNLKTTDEFRLDSRDDIEGAWKHHPIPEQALACPTQHMFEVMNPPPEQEMMRKGWKDNPEDIIGFKTVRFHGEDFVSEDGELYEATDFLIENFPCARFIINIRGDVEKQVKSWQTNFGMELDGEEVRNYNRMLVNVASRMGPERARLLDMSEWSQKNNVGIDVFNDLIEWLGFVDCKYTSLIHSNKDGYRTDREVMPLGKNCRYGGS